MAVVPIHAPSLDDTISVSIFARATDMIDNPIAAAGAARAHFLRNFIKGLIPGDTLPFSFTALANSFEWIKNPFGVIDLVMSRRPLGAVSSAAPWMNRIAFKLANLVSIFIDVSEQSTCRFAVETNSRNKRISPRDALRPGFTIPFDPVIPNFGRRILADSPVGMDDFGQFDRFAVGRGKLRDRSTCGSRGNCFYFSHRFSVLGIRYSVIEYRFSNYEFGILCGAMTKAYS